MAAGESVQVLVSSFQSGLPGGGGDHAVAGAVAVAGAGAGAVAGVGRAEGAGAAAAGCPDRPARRACWVRTASSSRRSRSLMRCSPMASAMAPRKASSAIATLRHPVNAVPARTVSAGPNVVHREAPASAWPTEEECVCQTNRGCLRSRNSSVVAAAAHSSNMAAISGGNSLPSLSRASASDVK